MAWFRTSEKADISSNTYCALLQLCAELKRLRYGKEIHSVISSCDIPIDGLLGTRLVFMYVSCGELSQGRLVFDDVANDKVFLWNLMLNEYAKLEEFAECLYLFRKMLDEGIAADSYTFSCILKCFAASGSSALRLGRTVHGLGIKLRFDTVTKFCNVLLDMYSKSGELDSARKVFETTDYEKCVVSWTAMIQAYARGGCHNEAIRLFEEMNIRPDIFTLSVVLHACGCSGSVDSGRDVHRYIVEHGLESDLFVCNSLMDMYAKCGSMEDASRLFMKMPVKDVIAWNTIIGGYGMHGLGKEAVEAFRRMRQEGIEPDQVSFISVLYACSHSGLVDEGYRFFEIMQNECNISPNLEHYACVVDLLSRKGKLRTAYEFINAMPISPDATIWGSLLCGCRIHHDVELAEEVSEHVFELEPENAGYYVLMSNIYAEAEMWDEARRIREKIGRRGLKKHPGCSWIADEKRVHVFVAGDSSHPEIRPIEALLEEIRNKMKEEGFSPKLRYALRNGDDAEKEMALCGHSEKLAMAYGMLNLPPRTVIRVFKNLRICRDCHETAKFVSKSYGKEIIVRDSNFFHHFKDGSCSCRGFW
ncbi:Pentatricopeptide repeat-containing protein DOT4, chloroplastic [Linum grandiflorum]